MTEEDPLGPGVRALFLDLAHAGDLATPAGGGAEEVACTGEAGRIAEGTRVRFCLSLSGNRVVQVRYRAYGCPFTLAICEWLARQLSGRQLSEPSAHALTAAVGGPGDWADRLEVPPQRLGRLLVVEDALRQALGASGGSGVDVAAQHHDPAKADSARTDSG